MSVTHVIGIDPGLVHTGVVGLYFFSDRREVRVRHEAVSGPNTQAVKEWIAKAPGPPARVFIEKYQPRSNLAGDSRMVTAVSEMHKALPGSKVLLNTGVKQVVRKPLMELLGVWSFSTVTNHQDLRSAARIAIYGMLKDESLNHTLTEVVTGHVDGRSWHVSVD